MLQGRLANLQKIFQVLSNREQPMPAYNAYSEALSQAGILTGGAALHPGHTATTVRIQNDKRQVHDDPYVDTKEQLGGFFSIDFTDLDTALSWAARCPAVSNCAVEVRARNSQLGVVRNSMKQAFNDRRCCEFAR